MNCIGLLEPMKSVERVEEGNLVLSSTQGSNATKKLNKTRSSRSPISNYNLNQYNTWTQTT